MANMFSGNQEKKIPRNLKDCCQMDSITQNLWIWCERLEKLGSFLFFCFDNKWTYFCYEHFNSRKRSYN